MGTFIRSPTFGFRLGDLMAFIDFELQKELTRSGPSIDQTPFTQTTNNSLAAD